MKSQKTIILWLFLLLGACTNYPRSGEDGGNVTLGYRIDRGEVVFVFDKRDYERASKNGSLREMEFSDINIHKVAISGEFNKWCEDGWKMKQVDENIFELRKKLKDFDDKFEWEYKFVVNDQYWAEPPVKASNRRDAGIMSPSIFSPKRENLVLSFEDPEALVGNSEFTLEGYPNAKNVVLAGSFNNWTGDKHPMVRQGNTWIRRLDLPPGNHEYKFIVDGKWITDPNNPVDVRCPDQHLNSVYFKSPNATFRLKGYSKAKSVKLSGSFNNWSHDGYEMQYQNGEWLISIYLPKGKHLYKFVIENKWIVDPDNPKKESDEFHNLNSVHIQP